MIRERLVVAEASNDRANLLLDRFDVHAELRRIAGERILGRQHLGANGRGSIASLDPRLIGEVRVGVILESQDQRIAEAREGAHIAQGFGRHIADGVVGVDIGAHGMPFLGGVVV